MEEPAGAIRRVPRPCPSNAFSLASFADVYVQSGTVDSVFCQGDILSFLNGAILKPEIHR